MKLCYTLVVGLCRARVARVAHANAEGLSLAVVFPSCRACTSPREVGSGTLSMRLSDLAVAEAGLRAAFTRSFPSHLHGEPVFYSSYSRSLSSSTASLLTVAPFSAPLQVVLSPRPHLKPLRGWSCAKLSGER
jgi:hypothetical protein